MLMGDRKVLAVVRDVIASLALLVGAGGDVK